MCWFPEDNALMTSPSADNDLLMLWASFNWLPAEPDFLTLSEPARSTKLSCTYIKKNKAEAKETKDTFCDSILVKFLKIIHLLAQSQGTWVKNKI